LVIYFDGLTLTNEALDFIHARRGHFIDLVAAACSERM